jgi:hypothetical protein
VGSFYLFVDGGGCFIFVDCGEVGIVDVVVCDVVDVGEWFVGWCIGIDWFD